MKIFIDSADIEEIKQVYAWGVCDGITTNPSLLKKAVELRKKKGPKIDIKSYIINILKTAKGTPVSLEVTQTNAAGMIEQGKKLYALFNPVAHNVFIKIPINPAFKNEDSIHFDGSGKSDDFRNPKIHTITDFDGLAAIKALSTAKIPVNCTLIFTPEQALMAAKAGAKIVSPFAGRVDDYLRTTNSIKFDKSDYFPAHGWMEKGRLLSDNGIVSGIDLVRQCVQILKNANLKTEVLAASLRNTRQVREAALVGAHIGTLPLNVIQDLLKHYKTYEGMATFTNDIVKEYAELTKRG